MKTLETLKVELLADGIIDAAEVQELKEVLYHRQRRSKLPL